MKNSEYSAIERLKFNKEANKYRLKSNIIKNLFDKYNEKHKMRKISYEKWKTKSIFLRNFFKKKSFNKKQKIFSSNFF